MDARSIPDSLIQYIGVVGGQSVMHQLLGMRLDLVFNYLCKFFLFSKKSFFRKLSYFKDKEAKVRVIGILD